MKDAQDVLSGKKEVLAQAQKELVDAQQALDDAKAAHADAQAKAKQLNDRLFELENADMFLEKANAKLAEAKDRLNKAEADLKDKQNAYDLAKADLDAKTAKVNENEAVLAKIVAQEEAKKALEEAEAKAKKLAEENAKNNFFYQAADKLFDSNGAPAVGYTVHGDRVFDARGNLVGYVSNDVKSRKVKAALQANALPQTGDKSDKASLVGAVILGLSSLLGFVEIDRRKKKEF